MVQSRAESVDACLAELAEPRRTVIAAVRDMVNRNLPPGYVEGMACGMIGWCVPLARYPQTYNGQALAYVALAAQKRHNALYLMGVYADSGEERQLRAGYAALGLKIDLGKCCLRFRDSSPPPETVLGPIIAGMPVERFISLYERSRRQTREASAC